MQITRVSGYQALNYNKNKSSSQLQTSSPIGENQNMKFKARVVNLLHNGKPILKNPIKDERTLIAETLKNLGLPVVSETGYGSSLCHKDSNSFNIMVGKFKKMKRSLSSPEIDSCLNIFPPEVGLSLSIDTGKTLLKTDYISNLKLITTPNAPQELNSLVEEFDKIVAESFQKKNLGKILDYFIDDNFLVKLKAAAEAYEIRSGR